MATIGLSEKERMIEFECIGLLPDLEEDVLFVDVLVAGPEESYISGLNEWWPDFVFDMFP
ncbi:MAG: hypothetical protein LBL73_12515 [Synergistaceae bacterium]|nr:hypothetical protein [Synergistaceae bacterium]